MSLLEQHFEVAFAASDGIKKLRELILTLAMQGKLVPQDPNDEPASELLRSIELDNRGNNFVPFHPSRNNAGLLPKSTS